MTSHANRALDIPDILISIISHVETQQDQAHFASLNRCCYETCTVPRVRSVKIRNSEPQLWSFLRFIRKWKIAGLCHSLAIDHATSVTTKTTLCLINLILEEIGESADRQLRYLSALSIQQATEVIVDDDESENITVTSFDQLTVECGKLLSGIQVLDDRLFREIKGMLSRRSVEDIDTSLKVWQNLSLMADLEELHIGMRQQSWSVFHNEAYNIKTLHLQIFRPLGLLGFLSPSTSLHSMQQLETLKLHSFAGPESIPIFQLTFPSLRTFEIYTSDATESPEDRTLTRFTQFVERHPHLQSISLGENYIRSAGRLLQSAENLRALHLSLPFSGTVLSIPAALGVIPHLTHLRLSGAVASVLMFLKNSPARPKLPHFRCIELECGDARNFKNLMRPVAGHKITFRIAQLWGLFPNLIEVAFSISFEHLSLFDVLPILLERLQECGKLRALRLRNTKPLHGVDAFPVSIIQNIEAIPPKLRYIVWENGSDTEMYELSADGDTSKGRRATRIAPLRSTPAKGRWSIDWHEASVFDHIAGEADEELRTVE